jgi:hypothetical protein
VLVFLLTLRVESAMAGFTNRVPLRLQRDTQTSRRNLVFACAAFAFPKSMLPIYIRARLYDAGRETGDVHPTKMSEPPDSARSQGFLEAVKVEIDVLSL